MSDIKKLKDDELKVASGGLDNREDMYYNTFWSYNNKPNLYFYADDAMELPNTSFRLFGYDVIYDPTTNTYTKSEYKEANTTELTQIYIIPEWYK